MTLRLEQENRLKAAGYETPDQRSALIYEYDQDDGEVLTTMTPFFIQSLLLPVAAFVVEESEVYAAGREQQLFSKHRSFTPVVWLRSSATLVDVRSRKMLDRYHLGVETLFAGAERVADAMKRIHPPGDPAARVSGMKGVIEAKLSDLTRLVRSGDRLSKAVNDSRRRMMHQIEKLPAGFASAQERRNEIIGRRANHLCTHLAPWGKLQERALAGFQFNLPSAGLLYQSIDPWKFEHQLIPL